MAPGQGEEGCELRGPEVKVSTSAPSGVSYLIASPGYVWGSLGHSCKEGGFPKPWIANSIPVPSKLFMTGFESNE